MKRNRKGFSLVELIVVLVIMAIIAALCAPNISAYVQAAKVQNYQTVANNLADELQTQLPQRTRCSGMRTAFCARTPEEA
jgi:type IV pilus assembly protein PilA